MKTDEKTEYIPLINDIMFKFIFGYQRNIRFTTYLLEAIDNVEVGSYNNKITITNSFNYDKLKANIRGYESDIIVHFSNGEKVILEAQTSWEQSHKIKNFLYVCALFATELSRGEDIKLLKKVREYNFIKIKGNMIGREYGLLSKDREHEEYVKDIMSLNTIDIANKKKFSYNYNERLKEILDLMNAESEEEALKIIKGKEILEDMYQEMKKFIESGIVPEFFTYGGFQKALGREEGHEAGKEEQTLNIAIKMLSKNKPIREIMEFTGLSKKELNELKKHSLLRNDKEI